MAEPNSELSHICSEFGWHQINSALSGVVAVGVSSKIVSSTLTGMRVLRTQRALTGMRVLRTQRALLTGMRVLRTQRAL